MKTETPLAAITVLACIVGIAAVLAITDLRLQAERELAICHELLQEVEQ